MTSLFIIGGALLLFMAFFMLTRIEERRGRRVFPASRMALDTKLDNALFIAQHVDFGAFVRDTARQAGERVLHDVAHLTLRAVRAVERLLAKLVRALRSRRAEGTEVGKSSAFVETMSDFKRALRSGADEEGVPKD